MNNWAELNQKILKYVCSFSQVSYVNTHSVRLSIFTVRLATQGLKNLSFNLALTTFMT